MNFFENINPFEKLKPKEQNEFAFRDIVNMLTLCLVSMFEYKKSKEYEKIDDRTIELCLVLNGLCAFTKDKYNNIVCGMAYDGGMLDSNGIGQTISISLLNGIGFLRTNNVDCVIGLNNPLMQRDLNIYITASQLNECLISEKCNVKYSRQSPIYTAKSSKIYNVVREALNRLKNGEPLIIQDDGIALNDKKPIDVTTITDVASIDKLQYLTTYYNAIMRRWFNRYGHNISDGMKQAQQSVVEVSACDSVAMIEPLLRLKERQKMCENLMSMYGGSISVDFSEAWKSQENDIIVDLREDINNGNFETNENIENN